MTYADVVQSKPKPFFDESIKPETARDSELGKPDASLNDSADEFIGVQRKHRKIKKFVKLILIFWCIQNFIKTMRKI